MLSIQDKNPIKRRRLNTGEEREVRQQDPRDGRGGLEDGVKDTSGGIGLQRKEGPLIL